MKRFIAVAVLFTMVICLLSCRYEGTYDEGYSEGYDDGYSDAKFEMECLIEEKYLDRYDIGYDDGYWEGYNDGCQETDGVIERAAEYARMQAGWSVYEAWNNISVYNDGVDPYGHDLPTEEEYTQSIETLVAFCEYLDNAGLGG